MKKFIKTFIVLTMLCCILAVAFTACNDKDVNEIEEFRSIMTAVLEQFFDTTDAQVLSKVSASKRFDDSVAKEIYQYMDSVEKEEYEEKYLKFVGITNFVAMLSYGEVLSEVSGSDKIYGVPMKVNMGEDTYPSVAYAVVLSKGTHRIAYLYGSDEKHGEVVYMYDIDYISKDNFSAKMILLNMDKLEVKSDAIPEAISHYVYGDTDSRAFYMMGEWDGESSFGGMAYKNLTDGKTYSSSSEDAVNNCFTKLKSQYEGIDFEYIRSLKEASKFDITYEQYLKVADALAEKYKFEI